MSSWDYRVVVRKSGKGGYRESFYELREVSYEDNGLPIEATRQASVPVQNTIAELRETLVKMLYATYKPLFKISELRDKNTG